MQSLPALACTPLSGGQDPPPAAAAAKAMRGTLRGLLVAAAGAASQSDPFELHASKHFTVSPDLHMHALHTTAALQAFHLTDLH